MDFLLEMIATLPGKAYLVGGAVRDLLLGREPKDYDFEIFETTPEDLQLGLQVLFGRELELSGAKFGVYRVHYHGLDLEFALPRREVSSGSKHNEFEIYLDGGLSLAEAARRRDFTINALYMDTYGQIHDPWNGRRDLERKLLDVVDPDTFGDDPLRPLRGMVAVSRFALNPTVRTLQACQDMFPDHVYVPVDAVMGEFGKWAQAPHKGLGLRFLQASGWLGMFPELEATIGCEQDPEHHPEGDVWEHTVQAVDYASGLAAYMVLCHDVGKVEGRKTHADSPLVRQLIRRITNELKVQNLVEQAVLHHMDFFGEVGKTQVRRLLWKLNYTGENGLMLWHAFCDMLEADQRGRKREVGPERQERLALTRAYGVEILTAKELVPLVQGRDLINEGLVPGPHFGPILKAALEAQLAGVFDTPASGIQYLYEHNLI